MLEMSISANHTRLHRLSLFPLKFRLMVDMHRQLTIQNRVLAFMGLTATGVPGK